MLQPLKRIDYRFVLGRLGDDVSTACNVSLRDAFERQIIRFGGTAGPDDFIPITIQQCGDLLGGMIHRLRRNPAQAVPAGSGVAECLAEIWPHRFKRARINGRGGVVIQVDRKPHGHSYAG